MWVQPHVSSVVTPTGGAVRVVGDTTGVVAGLVRHLPSSWAVTPAADVSATGPDDLAVLVYPTAGEVSAAHRTLGGGTRLVALIEPTATAERVAEVLEAGADTCVRAGSAAVLAGHLVACRRRTVSREPVTLRLRNTRVPSEAGRPLNAVRR